MAMYSDFLITCDFDRTLTAPDTSIPQANLDAIRYFTDNGGAFTVNTGRGMTMFHTYVDRIPCNAPLLLCNGSCAYDPGTEQYLFLHTIPMDQSRLIRELMDMAPECIVEFQALHGHFTFREDPVWRAFNAANHCPDGYALPGDDLGPFLKLCIYDRLEEDTVAHLFRATPEQMARFDALEAALREKYAGQLTVLRVAKRIIDIHGPGVSKGIAARQLQQRLGKKWLVCIGDEYNDLGMLREADFAFCPADGRIAPLFPNVCRCADGAVAEVILKKIPEIIKNNC